MARLFALAGVAAALIACDGKPAGHTLVVDVRTDLSPGVEFAAAETVARFGEVMQMQSTPALMAERWVDGRRVAEIDGVPTGTVVVQAVLRDSAGTVVLSRAVEIEIDSDRGLSIVLSRRCVSVSCPGSADGPAETECAAGRCTSPRCTAGAGATCGRECIADTDCGPCDVCAVGICLQEPIGACAADAGEFDDAGRDAGGLDAGSCAAFPRIVPRFPGPPPCSAATGSCLMACGDAICQSGCLEADPDPECVGCVSQNLTACANEAGCQSEWDALVGCVAAQCRDCMLCPGCDARAVTWNECRAANSSGCGSEYALCLPVAGP